MTALTLTLTRSDPAKNLHRYYRLDVQADLFGAWCFIREWGRIGCSGQVRVVPFPTPAEAQAALERQRRAKARRGYASAARPSDIPAVAAKAVVCSTASNSSTRPQ